MFAAGVQERSVSRMVEGGFLLNSRGQTSEVLAAMNLLASDSRSSDTLLK